MTDDELRALVRHAIARVKGDSASHPAHPSHPSRLSHSSHPSHLMLTVLPESDGPCLIEPAVPCNHCGYCKSLGH